MDNQPAPMQGKVCKCPHHIALPLVIVLIGLDFLLAATNVLTPSFLAISWPILLIVGGVVKMGESRCTCCERS